MPPNCTPAITGNSIRAEWGGRLWKSIIRFNEREAAVGNYADEPLRLWKRARHLRALSDGRKTTARATCAKAPLRAVSSLNGLYVCEQRLFLTHISASQSKPWAPNDEVTPFLRKVRRQLRTQSNTFIGYESYERRCRLKPHGKPDFDP